MKNEYIEELTNIRKANNDLWMGLIELGINCPNCKPNAKELLENILKNDGKISETLRRLIDHKD